MQGESAERKMQRMRISALQRRGGEREGESEETKMKRVRSIALERRGGK